MKIRFLFIKQNNEHDYYAFGSTLRSYVNSDREKYLFTAKERDEETDLDYFEARYYDSEIGVFRQSEPMKEMRLNWNTYNYCQNNPVMRIDPSGMLDDWVKNEKTGEYEWMDNVTSADNTPKGYKYIGSSGNDILNDINPNLNNSNQTQTSNRIGWIASDVEEGKYAIAHMINVKEKSSISVSADISYDFANKTSNNIMGRTFNGIKVSSTIISSNSDLDGNIETGAKLKVNYGNKSYSTPLNEPTGSYIKQAGTVVETGQITIPKSVINKNFTLTANVSGGWWVTNSSNLKTPVTWHGTIPIPHSFNHEWKIFPKAIPIPKNKL